LGFYSDKGYGRGADGVFYIKINNNSEKVLFSNFIEVNLVTLEQNLGDGSFNTSKIKSIENDYRFKVEHILAKDDGGAVLIGENYHSSIDASSSVHFSRKIIVLDFSVDGKIKWIQQIPKYQKTGNKHLKYANFGMHRSSEKLYFIFNDNPQNIDNNDINKVKTFSLMTKNAITMIVDVDNNGKMNKRNKSYNAYKSYVPWLRGLGFRTWSKNVAYAATSEAELLLKN
jgi:hypothetical protein